MFRTAESDYDFLTLPPSLHPSIHPLPVFLLPDQIDEGGGPQHVQDALDGMGGVGEDPQLPGQGSVDVVEGEGAAGLQEAEDLREGWRDEGREGGRE